MDKSQALEFDFRYIIKTILRRWYIILIAAILASAFSFYKGYHKVTTTYEARNSLIVGNPIDVEGTKYKISEVELYERFIETYSALARTSLISEKVASKLNKGISPEAIQGSITVTPQENTQFINVTVRWGNPQAAVELLNTFSEVFITEARNLYPSCTIQVIEKAKTPKQIIFSKKIYVYMAPIIGIIAGVVVIFGIELLDNTIRTEADVKEYLNISVIGEIPIEKKIVEKITPESIKKLNPLIFEAFRVLRTNIEFVSSCNNLKTITITSGVPGEGKTLTASMLAAVTAQTGKRTILVDCDLRNPNVHRVFRLTNELGLSNYLAGKAILSGVINKSNIENLSIITSGTKPPNPAELISSSSMKNLIKTLKNDFDYIIFDTPPVGLVTDAQILSQITDGVILVVSSGNSTKADSVKAKELIRQVGGKLIGVSLNKIRDSRLYKDYSYYYEKDNKKTKFAGTKQDRKSSKFKEEENVAT